MIYLDTGCLVKLYYPEPESALIVALVRGKPIWHTPSIGCRSLDILHCAAAKVLAASEFITTDIRQRKVAVAMGLNAVAL